MARRELIHAHSNAVINNNGTITPQLPLVGVLKKGEIAVNYKNGYETLSIENDAGEVIPFVSLEQTMAYTDASIVNADWNATSGKAQILNKPDIPDEKLSSSYQTSTLENDNLLLAGGDTYETAFSKIEKAILDNEETTAASLNDLNARKIEIDDVPTKTSQLINDSNFTTLSEVTLTIVNSAPATLDTLNELATALGNDPNFATTVSTALDSKANSADLAVVATSGSYNDLSNKPTIPDDSNLVHKTGDETIYQKKTFAANGEIHLASSWDQIYNDDDDESLQAALNARNNVQADWNLTTTTAKDYIKNKPNTVTNSEIDMIWNEVFGNLIAFTVENTLYLAVEGMTWELFVGSSYDPTNGAFYIVNHNVFLSDNILSYSSVVIRNNISYSGTVDSQDPIFERTLYNLLATGGVIDN